MRKTMMGWLVLGGMPAHLYQLGLSSGSSVTLTLVVQPQASGVYTNTV